MNIYGAETDTIRHGQPAQEHHDKSGPAGKERKETVGELLLHLGDQAIHYTTEVKKDVWKHLLPYMLKQAVEKQPFLLLTGKIFPAVKLILREKGKDCLEAK